MEFITFHDAKVVEKSASYILDLLNDLVKNTNKRILVGLSGGNSPKALYTLLSDTITPTLASKLVFVQVDERMVDPSHEDSNQKLIYSTMTPLLEKGAEFYPMPVVLEADDFTTACQEYEATLNTLLKNDVYFGLALLGVGIDGHTASIFPDQVQELPKDDRLVFMTPHEKNGYYRMSLSYKCIFDIANALFYVPGLGKREIVDELLDENTAKFYPSSKVLYQHKAGKLIASI